MDHKLRGILRHRAFGHADVSRGEGLTRPWGASYVPQYARRYFLIGSRDFFRKRQIGLRVQAQPRKRELGFISDKKIFECNLECKMKKYIANASNLSLVNLI